MQAQKQDWENFLAWYAVYPRREARADAWKAWQQTARTRPTIDEMIDAIRKAVVANEWTVDRRRFIPLPASWLRGQRWTDEFDVPESVLPALAPAKIRAPAEPQIDPAALAAWNEARAAVAANAMPMRGFADPRTVVVLQQIGWTRLAELTARDVPFVQREFVSAFLSCRASAH